jgi:hypothetical protein
VPVILVYPGVGVLGTVGEISIAAEAETVLVHTPFATMSQTAQDLYNAHRDAIEAAV